MLLLQEKKENLASCNICGDKNRRLRQSDRVSVCALL
jgi:hypothetical protein